MQTAIQFPYNFIRELLRPLWPGLRATEPTWAAGFRLRGSPFARVSGEESNQAKRIEGKTKADHIVRFELKTPQRLNRQRLGRKGSKSDN